MIFPAFWIWSKPMVLQCSQKMVPQANNAQAKPYRSNSWYLCSDRSNWDSSSSGHSLGKGSKSRTTKELPEGIGGIWMAPMLSWVAINHQRKRLEVQQSSKRTTTSLTWKFNCSCKHRMCWRTNAFDWAWDTHSSTKTFAWTKWANLKTEGSVSARSSFPPACAPPEEYGWQEIPLMIVPIGPHVSHSWQRMSSLLTSPCRMGMAGWTHWCKPTRAACHSTDAKCWKPQRTKPMLAAARPEQTSIIPVVCAKVKGWCAKMRLQDSMQSPTIGKPDVIRAFTRVKRPHWIPAGKDPDTRTNCFPGQVTASSVSFLKQWTSTTKVVMSPDLTTFQFGVYKCLTSSQLPHCFETMAGRTPKQLASTVCLW